MIEFAGHGLAKTAYVVHSVWAEAPVNGSINLNS
jgi:hypothetical protein